MVQVIENRADVDGRVVAIQRDQAKTGRNLVTLAVSSTSAVQGFPNLFSDYPGAHIDVLLPDDLAAGLAEGAQIRCRIRRAGPNVVIGERCTGTSTAP